MKSLCVKDKDTENINSKELKLSILFMQDGLSYSIYHTETKRYYALVSKTFENLVDYTANILQFIIDESLNKDFQEVNVVFANHKSTIIPEALFQEDKKEEIYSLNFELSKNTEILSSYLPKSGNIILFPVDKTLLQELRKIYGTCNLMSQSHPFIENHFVKNRIAEDSVSAKLFVQVFDDFIEIIVLKKSELIFYNTFKCKTNNDILYYIINVFEQLKLSQSETTVGFSGFIETDSLAVINLRKFVSVVYFESQNTDYRYYYKFQETAPHYYYNFLNVC